MIRRPPRSTLSSSSAASDVYKRQPERTCKHRFMHAYPVQFRKLPLYSKLRRKTGNAQLHFRSFRRHAIGELAPTHTYIMSYTLSVVHKRRLLKISMGVHLPLPSLRSLPPLPPLFHLPSSSPYLYYHLFLQPRLRGMGSVSAPPMGPGGAHPPLDIWYILG